MQSQSKREAWLWLFLAAAFTFLIIHSLHYASLRRQLLQLQLQVANNRHEALSIEESNQIIMLQTQRALIETIHSIGDLQRVFKRHLMEE